MYKVTSEGTYKIAGRGTVYAVKSPISAPRDERYLQALGSVVEIDGIERRVTGVEWHLPNRPVNVGETVGLLVA